MVILSLCDYSGVWSKPYREAGYNVIQADLQHGKDIRLLPYEPGKVVGILAAPPCTHFASSGARWWKSKGDAPLVDALALVDACFRAVAIYRPAFWALENPVGRLSKYIGPPKMWFDPCDFGDPYTKKTGLWGVFNPPAKSPVAPVRGSIIHRMSSSWKNQRSETPAGFATAFFQANNPQKETP